MFVFLDVTAVAISLNKSAKFQRPYTGTRCVLVWKRLWARIFNRIFLFEIKVWRFATCFNVIHFIYKWKYDSLISRILSSLTWFSILVKNKQKQKQQKNKTKKKTKTKKNKNKTKNLFQPEQCRKYHKVPEEMKRDKIPSYTPGGVLNFELGMDVRPDVRTHLSTKYPPRGYT